MLAVPKFERRVRNIKNRGQKGRRELEKSGIKRREERGRRYYRERRKYRHTTKKE